MSIKSKGETVLGTSQRCEILDLINSRLDNLTRDQLIIVLTELESYPETQAVVQAAPQTFDPF